MLHVRRRTIALCIVIALHVGVVVLLWSGRSAFPSGTGFRAGTVTLSFQLVSQTKAAATAVNAIAPAPAIAKVEQELNEQTAPADENVDTTQTIASGGDAECRPLGAVLNGQATLPMPILRGPGESAPGIFVDLTFQVDAQGHALPEGISISRSSGVTELDEAAVAYVASHPVSKPLCEGEFTAQRMAFRIVYASSSAEDLPRSIP